MPLPTRTMVLPAATAASRSPVIGLAPLQVCIQLNVDGGETKAGVAPQQALELAAAIVQLPRLVLRGVMSIPDDVPGFEAQREAFAPTPSTRPSRWNCPRTAR